MTKEGVCGMVTRWVDIGVQEIMFEISYNQYGVARRFRSRKGLMMGLNSI